eukprot:1193978-Prorocentrum_minimum.AAC.3
MLGVRVQRVFAAVWIAFAGQALAHDDYCPGSSWTVHAKCSLTAVFDDSCELVKYEVISRIEGDAGWEDPHNRGQYSYEKSYTKGSTQTIEGTHITGSGSYTDKFRLTFEELTPGECILHACSESQ